MVELIKEFGVNFELLLNVNAQLIKSLKVFTFRIV